MAEMLICTASHFFKITRVTPRGRVAIENFTRSLIHYGWVKEGSKFIKRPLKVFAASTMDRTEYRFHINQLNEFINHLDRNGIRGDLIEYEKLEIPTPVSATLKIKDGWILRDYQIPVVDYLISDNVPVAKFVNLATGLGKGMCALQAMSNIGYRTLIVVKSMYLEKWANEIEEKYDISSSDYIVIRGSGQLMSVLNDGESGELTAKIILISSKTISIWLKTYEKYQYQTIPMGYCCVPEDLCKTLGVGILLLDEAHQEFHSNFKFLLHTNVFRSISLSATLLSDDDFISKMYHIAYPVNLQYSGGVYKKYVSTTAVFYRFKDPFRIRHTDRISKTYNHHLFEQSILRSKETTKNYFNLIWEAFKGSYLQYYKPGQRCLVFCISIDMCTLLTSFLREQCKKEYSHLDINRYVAEDSFSSLIESDVSISTLGSAGTAVDIPALSTVILTIAVSSIQANLQSIGRLRPLKDGSTPRFLYLVCKDILRHIEYHEKKREMLYEKALSYTNIDIGTPL